MTDDKKPYGGKYETFAEWVKAEPDKFDDMDCRPGPSESDENYLLAVVPEHPRDIVPRIMETRRRARARAEVRQDGDAERLEGRLKKIAKAKPEKAKR
jgi:hypothetical protein